MSAKKIRRLVIGWVVLLAALLLSRLLPDVELVFYDNALSNYRLIPIRLSQILPDRTLLHPSITLVGHSNDTVEGWQSIFKMMQRYRQAGAAAVSASCDRYVVQIPKSLANVGLDDTKTYLFSTRDGIKENSGLKSLPLRFSGSDDKVREFYLATKAQGELRPTLPLLLYARFLGLDEVELEISAQPGNLLVNGVALPVREDSIGYHMPVLVYHSEIGARGLDLDITDRLAPIQLNDLLEHPEYFGKRCKGRFVFVGEYSQGNVGEKPTPLGTFRDFQMAALCLNTLIRGPHVRIVNGPSLWLFYLVTSGLLSLWMLGPTSFWGRVIRLALVGGAQQILAVTALSVGYYLPFAWLGYYLILLHLYLFARFWMMATRHLRRYGGAAALNLLRNSRLDDEFETVEERVATIVFVGLPEHLRQLEIDEDENILAHRQIFSTEVARITHHYSGIVHDFQADYLMLGFGTQPGTQDFAHAQKAYRAGLELVALRARLAKAWNPDPPEGARVQVSLNSGLVAIGWVGMRDGKKASAAIGDTTNVAARLLGTAKKLDQDLIVSASTFEFIQNLDTFEALPAVQLKGKSESVAIYKRSSP
jgi:class 3 adenylate cyclase